MLNGEVFATTTHRGRGFSEQEAVRIALVWLIRIRHYTSSSNLLSLSLESHEPIKGFMGFNFFETEMASQDNCQICLISVRIKGLKSGAEHNFSEGLE